MWTGPEEQKSKIRVLKPPGGGSSDIFGPAGDMSSPRRPSKTQSQLGSSFFNSDALNHHNNHHQDHLMPTSNGSSVPDTPRNNKPGNDSYKHLFGPPDAPQQPTHPLSKYHTSRSNIAISSSNVSSCSSTKTCTTPVNNNNTAKKTISSPILVSNGHRANPLSVVANGNGYHHNDVVGADTSSGMTRNPVTGDGFDVKQHASRRIVPRCKDGNPVTGAGYDMISSSSSASSPISNIQQNGGGSVGSSAGSDKSSTDSSPSVGSSSGVTRLKNRVPPGGFSSGLW